MKSILKLLPLVVGAAVSVNAQADAVTDRSGTYDLSCKSATLRLKVGYGIGTTTQSANSILGGVAGKAVTVSIPVSCTATTVTLGKTSDFRQQVLNHCNTNLIIPTGWPVTCASIADSATAWADSIEGSLSKSLIDKYKVAITMPTTTVQKLLGQHPTALTLTRVNQTAISKKTVTYNSGNFDIANAVRYPFVAGLNGYSCFGGLVDVANGNVSNGVTGFRGTADESAEAGIACTKNVNNQLLAVGVTLDLDATYSGVRTGN